MTNQNAITIVNLTDPKNLPIFEKLKAKLGAMTDELTLFAYQNGIEPLSYKYHEKQKRLFVEYPRFNMLANAKQVVLYLKRNGEAFPSKCFKIKKTEIKTSLTSEAINEYINETVDVRTYVDSPLNNEINVVMDGLKVNVLLKAIEKERKVSGATGPITYAVLYDMIRSKFDEVVDCGYLELLNKTCVMMWQTYDDPSAVIFKALSTKIDKANPPQTKASGSSDTIIKNIVKESKPKVIPEFTNPSQTPVLENILDDQKELTQN